MKKPSNGTKIQRISYKLMYDFLQTQEDETVISVGSLSKCLACKTVQHFFSVAVTVIRDYKGRNEFSYFSSFQAVSPPPLSRYTLFVVPDGFATWCRSVEKSKHTVKQLKKVLTKLSKKKLV